MPGLKEEAWLLAVVVIRSPNRSQLSYRWIVLSKRSISIHWMEQLVSLVLVNWIEIYPVDSADNAIHRINLYPRDNAIQFLKKQDQA